MLGKIKIIYTKLIKFWPIALILFCFWLLLGVKVPEPLKNGKTITQKISVLQYLIKSQKNNGKKVDQKIKSSGLKSVSILNITANEFTPTLEAWSEVQSTSGSALELVSEVSAKVIDIADIYPGSEVKEGQRLITLDNSDATYKVEQAQARLDELNATLASAQTLLPLEEKVLEVAQKAYMRYQDLADKNVTSTANLENQLRTFLQAQQAVQNQKNSLASLEAQIISQKSVLKEAQNNLEKTQIKAPVDGRILEINVQKGQFLNLNTAVLRMVNINEQEVQSLVSFSKMIAFLPDTKGIDSLIGLKGYFTLEENGYHRDWPITVSAIPAELSAESRDIKIRFSFDNPTSAPLLGTYGLITLVSPENQNIIIVPRDSIRQNKAYILDGNNKIYAQEVTTSIIGDKWLWVQSGLSLKDKFVIQPPIPFVEGIKYEYKEDPRVLSMLNKFISSSDESLKNKGINND